MGAPNDSAVAPARLAERLSGVRVALREDLEVTRHVFRGEPTYIIRDPMTFQSHRLDPADYSVFVSIQPQQSLGQLCTALIEQGRMSRDDEEAFYRFILHMHRLNFLNLPVSDDKLLFQRHMTRQRAKRRQRLRGFLCLRVPLVNPDPWLEATIRYVRPFFSRGFCCLWLVLVASAAFVVARRFEQLVEPVQGLLVAQNLPLIGLALIVLKLIHEFGHAYACKHFGGYVPEMGAYLILLTPCAYVDATAAWGFTRKRDRILVSLAGMGVEAVCASIAVFVWALTPPGLVHDLAYNVVFLAGVVTVLFNLNPLLRYDGYYILSDLVEVPNLRERAARYVAALAKRIVLGIPVAQPPTTLRLRLLLASFGVGVSVYRCVILLAIAALVATKLHLVGMVLATAYVASVVVALGVRLVRYLWWARETAPVRARAVAASVVLPLAAVAALLGLPVQPAVRAAGVLRPEHETVVRAGVDGFLASTAVELGRLVRAGDPVAELTSYRTHEAIAEAVAEIRASEIREAVYQVEDPARALAEARRARVLRRDLQRQRARQAELVVRAPGPGRIVAGVRRTDLGRFVRRGDPVATIAGGGWQVCVLLSEAEMAAAQPAVGQAVELRIAADPGPVRHGVIRRVAPRGSREIENPSLTHLAGGAIAVDPATSRAAQPYVEVRIDLDPGHVAGARSGMTCRVRFGTAEPTTIARHLLRRLMRFRDALL